jgi:hypothetical protein
MQQHTSRRLIAATIGALGILAACSERSTVDPTTRSLQHSALRDATGDAGEAFVCMKGGPAGTYNFHVTIAGGGDWVWVLGPDLSINFDGSSQMNCSLVAHQNNPASWGPGITSTITVTQLVPPNMQVDSIQRYNANTGVYDAIITGTPTASKVVDYNGRPWFKYFDSPLAGVCQAGPNGDCATGRMTGGGATVTIGDMKITKGFTLHCDITLSNNLEINWPGHKWHLDKPITSAVCIDDPTVNPVPPPAPFDTFIGEAIGQLDGVDGARIKFTLVDAGEPGKGVDKAAFQIWDVNGNLVLNLPLQPTSTGNVQAHYDQPHK